MGTKTPPLSPLSTPPFRPPFRLNLLAVILAAILAFLVDAGWYSYFRQLWLAGIGHTGDWLMANSVNPALQYATALVSLAVMAAVISYFVQRTGRQTVFRGVWIAFWMWLGVVVTTFATDYVFEARSARLYGIDTGVWLVDMIVMGIVVGAWKTRPAAIASAPPPPKA